MNDRIVRYKAIADFLSLSRDFKRATENAKELKRAEDDLNKSSAASSAKADAADTKRLKTRERLIKTAAEYAQASKEATASDSAATAAARSRNSEQAKQEGTLKKIAKAAKDYSDSVSRVSALERQAGGAKKTLATAQQQQIIASKRAEEAAGRLQRAQERLAATERATARESVAASAARVKAASAAERAAGNLARAEQRLASVPTPRADLLRKAELSLADARARSSKAASDLEAAEKRLSSSRTGRDDNRIRKAERDVASALVASTKAADTLEHSSKRVSNILETLQGAGAGLGGLLGNLSKGVSGFASGLGGLLPKLIAIGFAIPLILSALSALISGLAAVGAGAVALVSAMSPMIGLLGALPGAIGGAVFAIGTLAAAFFGIGDAVKESLAAQKNAGKVAKDSAKAQRQAARQVADALRSLRNAKESQARGEVAANRAVRDAILTLKDARESATDGETQANRSLVLAERGLRDAQDNSRLAQLNLTQARANAIRNIRDLQEAVEDAARAEEGASISVEEARLRLQEVLSDPNSTDLQKRSAELAVREAQDALSDTQKQAEDTRKEYDKARKQGVEKSDAVVDAKKQERDAIEALADAQLSVSEAVKAQTKQQIASARAIQQAQESLADAVDDRAKQQRDAAEGVVDAQRNVSDAYQSQKDAANVAIDAAQKLRDAMDELSPAGKKFVQLLLDLKPLLDKIRFAAQEGLFPGLSAALLTLAELAPIITPAVKTMAQAIGDAAKQVADLTKSPIFRGQLARILESSAKIMGFVGRVVANLVTVFVNIADAARPFTEWLFETAEGWTEQWAAMTSGKKGQKKLTDFFAEAKETLKVVGGLIFDFVRALLGIGKASKGVGKDFLKNLSAAAATFSEFVNSKEGQARIKKWFEDIAPVVRSIAKFVSDFVSDFFRIASDPKAAEFFEVLRTKFLPALTEAITTMGSGFATDVLSLLSALATFAIPGLQDFRDLVDVLNDLSALFGGEGGDGAPWVGQILNFFLMLNKAASFIGILPGLIVDIKKAFEGELAAPGWAVWANERLKDLKKNLQDMLNYLSTQWKKFYNNFIEPIVRAFKKSTSDVSGFRDWFKTQISNLLTWIKENWAKVFGFLTVPLIDALARMGVSGGDIRDFFQDLWDSITRGAFTFVDTFGSVVDKLREAFADPIRFVIETVINGGLIDGFNGLVSKITGNDKLNIQHIKPPQFATGGVYPGYTPGRDIGYIGVSGGEAIMRPEWTRAVGRSEVDNMNAAARRGGKKGVQRYLGGFANGGEVTGSSSVGEFAPTTFRGKRMNFRTVKMLLAAEKLYGGQFSITQGSYSTSVAASGGTHAGGGVLDLGWTGAVSQVSALRRAGFAAWHRNPSQGPWRDHVHAAALGDPTESPSALRQVASYLAGGDGLGGTDDGPRVPIDPDLASALGITDAQVAAAIKNGGGPSLLSRLAGWIQSAVSNPVEFLKEKIAAPVQEMFSKFGNGALTQALAKLPEYAMGAMAEVIKNSVGGAVDSVVPGGKSGNAEVRSMVQKRAAQYGWGDGGNWDALQWIIQKESGWNPNAQNPNSTAYGLFQFLDGTWSAYGASKSSDPGVQTDAGLRYIKSRYGTPEAARAFHQNYGWYAGGGVVPTSSASPSVAAFASGGHVGGVGNRDTVPAMLTPGEFVLRKNVAKKIGKRKLEHLNSGRSSSLKPTDAGIQHFHAGGPVLGMKPGTHGNSIRALRYLLSMPTGPSASYANWDSQLDKRLRPTNAWEKITGPLAPLTKNPKRGALLNYIRKRPGVSFDHARDALRLNDAQMLKMWESVKPNAQKTIPGNQWATLDKGYRSKRSQMYGYVKYLNSSIGLKGNGETWNGQGRAAMKHILEHAYGRPHAALEYRPWQYFTPAETAANNAIAANKKQGEFNGALEILSNWGLTDLVTDLLGKGVDEGYNVALSASKNQAVATILNNEIKKSKLLTTEDQANILKMISTLASSTAQIGLRDMSRNLKISELDTVLLYENAQKLGRLSKVPGGKLSKLKSDVASFRAGTFYAADGGLVPGSGTGDTVPAMLTPGEFVLQKAAVQALGLDKAHWLNNKPQKFAKGGLVQQFSLAGAPTVNMPRVGASLRSGSAGSSTSGGVTNHWDIDIHNPVAENSTKSLTKTLQRQSVLKGSVASDN